MQLNFAQKYFILILHTLATLLPVQQYIPSFIAIVQATATTATVQMTTMSSVVVAVVLAADVATAVNVQQNDSVAITRNAMKVVNENDFEEILSQKLTDERTTEKRKTKKLLSRKRRYLLFPEGSSFQLVYDGIYGVVDYTNYLILGITVALAWELPSKPQSEVIEEIAERIKDGRLNLRRNDTAGKITYVDTKSTKKKNLLKLQPVTQKLSYLNLANRKTYGNLRPNYNYYYKSNKLEPLFRPPMNTKYYNYRPRPSNNIYYSTQKYAKYPNGNTNGYGYQRKGDWRRKDNYYYSPNVNPFTKWTKKPQYVVATPNVKYPWWNLASRLSNSFRRKSPSSSASTSPMITATRRIDNTNYRYSKSQQQHKQQHQQQQQKKQNHQTASGYYQSTAAARKHRIYPVFGKRSIPDEHNPHAPLNFINSTNATTYNQQQQYQKQQQQQHHHHRQRRSGITGLELTNMERIHIRHHRSTRQTLYEKIEKYLDKLGIRHSHHCVLRALCETGQKSIERTPGTFVGELMRAVFTLPEALDEDLHAQRIQYKDQRYDAAAAAAANAIEGGDCATRYQLCEHSLWKSQFVA